MPETMQLTVTGMTCGGCENAVKKALQTLEGVEDVSASRTANVVGVTYDANKVTPAMLTAKIESLGYDVAPSPPA